jgi:ureidoglycolate lyase
MTKTHKIKVELMTRDSFAPFGDLIEASQTPDEICPVNFEGGALRMNSTLLPYRGLVFSQMEQHFHVTQAFLPLDGPPLVVAVAAATDQNDPAGIPTPEECRAFLIDGTIGYILKKGTWHSDRLPLYPPGTKMVILTDDETNRDLRAHGSIRTPSSERGGWEINRIVDYRIEFDVSFELIL